METGDRADKKENTVTNELKTKLETTKVEITGFANALSDVEGRRIILDLRDGELIDVDADGVSSLVVDGVAVNLFWVKPGMRGEAVKSSLVESAGKILEILNSDAEDRDEHLQCFGYAMEQTNAAEYWYQAP